LTFKERRKRADAQKIFDDFERIESSFLSFAQKLNKKRQAQMIKRIERVIPKLIEAHEKGDTEEVQGILLSLKMPSSKEWYKGIHKLVLTATETGILRAHMELLRLKELYEFEESWTADIINEGYDFDVVLPEEARRFIRRHAYEVGVITEETVIRRIRTQLENGLDEGVTPKEMKEMIKQTVGTWISDFHAQTIARTETGKFYNAGRLARWLDPEAGDFVEALQYDAIVDTRTTDLCRHLDGKIIAITDSATIAEYTPPNHYQCRATWLPVTKYEEWEADFDTSLAPEDGFNFKSPLPKLLDKKKEPLVQVKSYINPEEVTDPDIIRTLDDDGFKVAIKNVKDPKIKLHLIIERAESMVVRETGLRKAPLPVELTYWGYYSGDKAGMFDIENNSYKFYMDASMKDVVDDLMGDLMSISDYDKAKKLVDKFIDKHGKDPLYVDLIHKLILVYNKPATGVAWDGLKPVKRSKEAKALFKIKEPPKTVNYKNATGLQQALKDGQAWIDKYVDDKLAPKTGIKLRFSKDNLRAYAIGSEGTIHFGPYERNAGVIIHESAHVMHWNSVEVSQLIEEFFMRRTNNLQIPWAKRHGEDVIPDDFYNSYVGRVYGWEEVQNRRAERNNSSLRFYGQEVLSMGMQAMYEDPMKFYREDKEHFLLTYAIMRGLF
jgi:SPP1 gp7 family putative phage head morphogenesis protein